MPPRQNITCFNCGTAGHGVRECPDISCLYCHVRGHIVDNCPKKRHRSPGGSDGSESGGVRPYPARQGFGGGAPLSNSNSNANTNTVGGSNNNTSNSPSTGSIPPPTLVTMQPRYGDGYDKCYTCKEHGHRSEACAMTVCHDCGRKGHIAKSCPRREETRKCYFCKRKGHQISDCELKRMYPNEDKLCYMCLKPGHHANECGNAAVCHMCAQSGHISNDCPNRECANCHDKGHSVTKCPTVRCFKCHESGHMANECATAATSDDGNNAANAAAVATTDSVDNANHYSANNASTAGPSSSHIPQQQQQQRSGLHNQLQQYQYQQQQQPQQQYYQQQQAPTSRLATPPVVSSPAGVLPPPSLPAPLPALPALDETVPRPPAANGRVCVLIDGPYFEASVRQADPHNPDYGRIRVALQHTLQFIGTIFDKTPYGFWFDMDTTSMCEFIDQEFAQPQKDAALRRLHGKHVELVSHMCSGRGLSNVVTRLVGKIRHRPVVGQMGFGGSWMPAGVDVAIATSIIECFESRQFSQVVLLSGDGALCPAVDFCNAKRQAMGAMADGSAKPPVRVCGPMSTMDATFGSKQELVDFLPRIFLDAPEHFEESKKVPFAINTAFQ